MNPPVHHQQKHRVQQLSLWLLVALAGISLHWLASSSESLLEAKFGEETPRSSGSGTNHSGATISTPPATRESAVDQTATRRFLVFAAVVFIGASVLIYRHRAALIGPRLRHFDLARTQPRHVLVLFVSPEDHIDGKTRLVEGTEDSAGQWTLDSQPYLTQAELAVASVPAARVKLAINQVPKGVRWPWQQTLRAIEPHLRHDTLREIWLLGSSGKHGSYRELDRLEKLLGAVLGKSVEIRRDGRDFVPANQKADYAGCDFEEYDTVVGRLGDLVRHLTGTGGWKPRDLAIDITSGQKTASIAAASATLNSEVVFQYVQTNHPIDVLTYDVTYTSEPRAH